MARAYLGLGANIGNPPAQLEEAIRQLEAISHIQLVALSTMISSKAWGKTDQPDFSNMVIAIETDLKPTELLDACLVIEMAMGRVRREVWGPRLIDIDIIAYDKVEMRSSRLTLPHPFAHTRDFVLDPLREIAPEVADWVAKVNSKAS